MGHAIAGVVAGVKMPRVLIGPSTLSGVEGPHSKVLRDAGLEIAFPRRAAQMTADELLTELQGIDAVIAGSEPYTRRVLEAAPSLRVIARAGVGYDAVDLEAATAHGIAVAITPGTNQDAVAEHAFALILALAKKVVSQHIAVKGAHWPRQATLPLRGRALGIAGLGRIGKSVAIRGAAFGMRLLAYEPIPDHDFIKRYAITLMPFEQLLADSDFLTLHMPLFAETKHLMNRQTLSLMKPSAFLINTARGGLVSEVDLVEALRSKRLAGAGLDVFEQEPLGKSPLLDLDNVVFTAHTAGVDLQSLNDMAVSAAQSIAALRKGAWPADQIVNPEVRANFRW
jgi:D-3-phosphoglycerate dehydrogenase / 2-oxoglutarate reductase